MTPVAVLASLEDGAELHQMDADFAATYGTAVGLYHPVYAAAEIPHYESLDAIPGNLPAGQDVSLARNAILAPVDTGSQILNGFYQPDGTPITEIPNDGTQPNFLPALGALAAALLARFGPLVLVAILLATAVLGSVILLTITTQVVSVFKPPCGTENQVVSLSSNVALLQSPNCQVTTVDKTTGKVVGTPGPGQQPISDTLIWGAVGLVALWAVMTFIKRKEPSSD